MKTTFFAEIFKIQGGLSPPSDAHVSLAFLTAYHWAYRLIPENRSILS